MKNIILFTCSLFSINSFAVYAANICPSDYIRNNNSQASGFFSPSSIPLNVKITPSKENELTVYIYGDGFMQKIDKPPYRGEYYLTGKKQLHFEFCKNNSQLGVFSINIDKKTIVECIENKRIDCLQDKKIKIEPKSS